MSIRVALILGVAIVLGALVNGGIYQTVTAGASQYGVLAFRVNRFTGSVVTCTHGFCGRPEWRN